MYLVDKPTESRCELLEYPAAAGVRVHSHRDLTGHIVYFLGWHCTTLHGAMDQVDVDDLPRPNRRH